MFTVPAVVIGIILGPIAARVLDSQQWVMTTIIRQDDITLGVMRVMIGIQLSVLASTFHSLHGICNADHSCIPV